MRKKRRGALCTDEIKAAEVLDIGEIVLIVADEKNWGEWRKGKVVRHIRGKDGVVRGLSLLHKGHHIDKPLNLVCPLEIRQAVTSDKGVSTAQSQPPVRTRIRRQAAETAKDRIREVIANEEDDWTLILNWNKDCLKIELHSIFRGAWPKRNRKCRDTHLNWTWLF